MGMEIPQGDINTNLINYTIIFILAHLKHITQHQQQSSWMPLVVYSCSLDAALTVAALHVFNRLYLTRDECVQLELYGLHAWNSVAQSSCLRSSLTRYPTRSCTLTKYRSVHSHSVACFGCDGCDGRIGTSACSLLNLGCCEFSEKRVRGTTSEREKE